MARCETCLVEFYFTAPLGATKTFRPSFTVFFQGGLTESHQGGNSDVATLLSRMGAEGWRISSAATQSNWVLWTLERTLD